ncbi:MAG TPA: VWA domain-containing protein [Terriglobales bacterium]|nr:VWA domain-containing protein [Terriglobales bacterium]
MWNWYRIARFKWLFLVIVVALVSGVFSQQTTPSISVDVRLVNLNVAVLDKNGRTYTGLTADRFRIYDNGVEQSIHHFSAEDMPYSLGMVLDRSGSMSEMIQDVYNAAYHTVRASKPGDEFFVELFNDRVEMRQDVTSDQELLQRQLKGVVASGSTALYDAILVGLNRLKQDQRDKKALLVVTDGADNSSKHSFQEVLERARADGVVIYMVGMFDQTMPGAEEDQLRALLEQIAEVTGGRAYFPRTVKQCEEACIAIAKDLREQYSLGYYPRPKLFDGSWRTIQVQLALPEDLYDQGLRARTRAGYYTPRQ